LGTVTTRRLTKIFTETPDLDRIQANVDASIRSVSNNPLLRGRQVTTTFVSGTNRVAHGLGREWQGWFIVDQTSTGDIFSTTTQAQRDRFLTLSGSLTGRTSLWVF